MTADRRKEGAAASVLWRLLSLAAAALLLYSIGRPAEAAEPAGTIGGAFAIERLQLSFEDGSAVKVVGQGDTLHAEADMKFSGSGLLSGAWEVAEPTTTAGSPTFRRLEVVNERLSAGRQRLLRSPVLPTDITGTHVLRLKIVRPATEPELVSVRYFVGRQPSAELLAGRTEVPESITTQSPAPGAKVTGETKFSWEPVPGSIAYQIEIYDKEGTERGVLPAGASLNVCMIRLPSELDRPPTVGLLVPAFKTESTLSQLAGRSLTAGKAYLWRVVALAKGGKVLCESPMREFSYGGSS